MPNYVILSEEESKDIYFKHEKDSGSSKTDAWIYAENMFSKLGHIKVDKNGNEIE
tara:strand:+ start:81 stop:245 length:165 start_codon:yes stop_codon:yes gene_type:complete